MKVRPEDAGSRLDVYIAANNDDITRSYAAKLIKSKSVHVNKQLESASYSVREGDEVSVDLPQVDTQEANDIPILHKDENLIVIDKPQGLLVHAKDSRNAEHTVKKAMADLIDRDTPRGGIVHRLDRDTTGVMVIARNAKTHSALKNEFQARTIKKHYIAAVDGVPRDAEALLKWPLARWPKHPALFRVDANGKPAQTLMRVNNRGDNSALVLLKPKTGRTHQLRVHMAHYGNPIHGDRFYNPTFKEGQKLMLHAQKLAFTIGGRDYEFVAHTPERFLEYVSTKQ